MCSLNVKKKEKGTSMARPKQGGEEARQGRVWAVDADREPAEEPGRGKRRDLAGERAPVGEKTHTGNGHGSVSYPPGRRYVCGVPGSRLVYE